MCLPVTGRSASQEHYRSGNCLSRAAGSCGIEASKKYAVADRASCRFDRERDCSSWRLVPLAPTKANRESSAHTCRDLANTGGTGGNRQGPAAVTCSGARTGRDAKGTLVGTCSGTVTAGKAQFVANAGNSPNRGATDTRNGVNTRGYIRYGKRG